MKNIDEQLNDLWEQADKIILTEVERLARNVLKKNPKTKEFINAMGSFFFTVKGNKNVHLNISTKEEILNLIGGKELFDFVYKHDQRFKITGEPMRFTETGPIITDW